MHTKSINIYWSVTIVIVALFFYSCETDYKKVNAHVFVPKEPSGVAEKINLKHTDSGVLKANLISDKMLDYANKDFAYSEFPEGIVLYFYDENKNRNILVADYGIVYNKTDLVDLRGNVKLTTFDGKKLEAKQLYWDQKNKWIFTNEPYRYSFGGGFNEGDEFDANQEFTIFSSRNNHGEIRTK